MISKYVIYAQLLEIMCELLFLLDRTRTSSTAKLLCSCDSTLYTCGFVDDVMFSRNRANGQNQRRRICFVDFSRVAAPEAKSAVSDWTCF